MLWFYLQNTILLHVFNFILHFKARILKRRGLFDIKEITWSISENKNDIIAKCSFRS